MTSERSERLADDFAAANAEAVAFARSCPAAAWQAPVPGEEWTVGVVLHHIAEGHAGGLAWLEALAAGEAVTDSPADLDRRNMEHAGREGGYPAEETVALLVQNGERTEAALRRLSEEELDRTAPFGPAGGQALPTEAMAGALVGHIRGHLDHARAAAAGLG
jgi:DinB superfamily